MLSEVKCPNVCFYLTGINWTEHSIHQPDQIADVWRFVAVTFYLMASKKSWNAYARVQRCLKLDNNKNNIITRKGCGIRNGVTPRKIFGNYYSKRILKDFMSSENKQYVYLRIFCPIVKLLVIAH